MQHHPYSTLLHFNTHKPQEAVLWQIEDRQKFFINWMLKKTLDQLSESGFLRIHRQLPILAVSGDTEQTIEGITPSYIGLYGPPCCGLQEVTCG